MEHYKEGRITKREAEEKIKKLLEKAKSEKTKRSILAYLGALKRAKREEHKHKKHKHKKEHKKSKERRKLHVPHEIVKHMTEEIEKKGGRLVIHGEFLPGSKHKETLVIYERKSKEGSRVIEPANFYPVDVDPRKLKRKKR